MCRGVTGDLEFDRAQIIFHLLLCVQIATVQQAKCNERNANDPRVDDVECDEARY